MQDQDQQLASYYAGSFLAFCGKKMSQTPLRFRKKASMFTEVGKDEEETASKLYGGTSA